MFNILHRPASNLLRASRHSINHHITQTSFKRFIAQAVKGNMPQHCYDYPRPAVTVDAIIIAQPSEKSKASQILLIKRKNEPFKGRWALPGGFVDQGETLDAAAARELKEETSVEPSSVLLTQVGAFGDPGRDPRGWTVTVAYAALVPSVEELGVQAADDAEDANWFPVKQLPVMAFDHKLVVKRGLEHLAVQPQTNKIGGLVDELKTAASLLQPPWVEKH